MSLGETKITPLTDPQMIVKTDTVIPDAVSVSAMETGNQLVYMMRTGNDLISLNQREKVGRAFVLAAECLAGDDISFGKFVKALESSSV
jgi:hypothetical protein